MLLTWNEWLVEERKGNRLKGDEAPKGREERDLRYWEMGSSQICKWMAISLSESA